jgi:hypothetical protein
VDNSIAGALLDSELQCLRILSYSGLVTLIGSNDNKEVVGRDGETYQLEIDVLWDEPKMKNVRVVVSADDGKGWRSLAPLTRSFIKRPDGALLAE